MVKILWAMGSILSVLQGLDAYDVTSPLPKDKINEYPFNVVGRVYAGQGTGSGVAVSQKVVFSAAHVFIDRETAKWSQSPFHWKVRYSPSNRGYTMSARSYRYFDDYAEATRRFQPDDLSQGSWEQFNLDAITLIFYEDVADGGYAGWASNQITSNSNKMIVGYPSAQYSESDQRQYRMHSTSLNGSPAKYKIFNHRDRLGTVARRVYITRDLLTYPGNSGGPVYGLITFPNGTVNWGVIGLYVGGTIKTDSPDPHTRALAIDDEVYDLIKASGATDGSALPILQDDHGDTRVSATKIELNHSVSGNLETRGDIDYFRFSIYSSGAITVSTTGSTDTLGTLRNGSGNVVTTNDDSGSRKNFLITRNIEPGTYYIVISSLSDEETGKYSVHIDFTETVILPDLSVNFVNVDKRSITVGETLRVNLGRSNTGDKNSSIFSHGLYLSRDNVITTRDRRLVNFARTSMGAGTTRRFSHEVNISAYTSPGTYYLGYILDFNKRVKETDETNNTGYAVITVVEPVPDNYGDLVIDGSGRIAGENIQHPNGNVFDQVLLTGPSIKLKAKPGQITRVSFMDENEDIVQVEFSGAGTFTVTLDPELLFCLQLYLRATTKR